jgi:hypothetical protein
MSTIAQIRTGLKDALGTIDGLRVSETILSSPTPPMAMVGSPTVTYDEAFGGSATYSFPVVLIVSRADDKRGQERLDTYLEPSGSASIPAAIHSDPTLGGVVQSVVVRTGTPGIVQWGEIDYYQAEFTVEVYG